jgi:hypothetical protein
MTEPETSDCDEVVCQEHSIIQDLIDITPDKSQTIYYCKHCFACFDSLCVPCK